MTESTGLPLCMYLQKDLLLRTCVVCFEECVGLGMGKGCGKPIAVKLEEKEDRTYQCSV